MLASYTIKGENEEINIEIIRSNRRTMAIEIRPDGKTLARVPKRTFDYKIKQFLSEHEAWILRKHDQVMKRLQLRQNNTYSIPSWDSLSAQDKKHAKEKIVARVEYFASLMDIDYGNISMKNQKSRWGSCSSKGNLNFNYRLAYLPDELLDYVVVHELSHRLHMNHSKDFWSVVQRYDADYKLHHKILRETGIE